MPALTLFLDRLADATRWTYRASRESSAEPAAWSAMALAAHGRHDAAVRPAQWLAGLQQADGSVGISATQDDPRWPTSLAMLAWSAADNAETSHRFREHIERAATWGLASRGKTAPRSTEVGHDTSLVGWSWAADTHSWLEPTCMFVMGLRAAGQGDHPRVREGVRLIVDRLLPAGGANYGNTIVLGQPLVAHLLPTGLAMLAIGGERISDSRVERSLDYLVASIDADTAAASMALACLGLAAHGSRPARADAWIERALDKRGDELAAYELALLLLAAASTPFASMADQASLREVAT